MLLDTFEYRSQLTGYDKTEFGPVYLYKVITPNPIASFQNSDTPIILSQISPNSLSLAFDESNDLASRKIKLNITYSKRFKAETATGYLPIFKDNFGMLIYIPDKIDFVKIKYSDWRILVGGALSLVLWLIAMAVLIHKVRALALKTVDTFSR